MRDPRITALDAMAEDARALGLDYTPRPAVPRDFAAGLARVAAGLELRAYLDKLKGAALLAEVLTHANRCLGQIGRRAHESMNPESPMTKPNYRVTLIESDGERRIDLGIYSASGPDDAVKKATTKYRGTLRKLETGRWKFEAQESFDRPVPAVRRVKAITEPLI